MPGDKAAAKGHGVSLLDQHRLAIAGMSDMRLSSGDKAVLGTIIERYRRDKGGSRVAYSYITLKTGLSRRSAIDCVRRLVDREYISVRVPGSGTRPAEYLPNWSAAASGEPHLTTTSGEADFTTVVNHASPLGDLEVKPASPIPTYVSGLQPADGKEEPETTPGAAPAPALAGGPDAPRDPGGFDELWGTYEVRRGKARARAAYERLAPDAALQADLLAGARRWRDAYDAQDRPAKYRKALHTWLAGECWDCDPDEAPATHKARHKPASAKQAERPASSPPPQRPTRAWEHDWDDELDDHGVAYADDDDDGLVFAEPDPAEYITGDVPAGQYRVEIFDSAIVEDSGDLALTFHFRTDAGHEFSHCLAIQDSDIRKQEAGQKVLGKLCQAADLTTIEDSEELHGIPMMVTLSPSGRITYTANDNIAQEQAA